MHVRTRYARSGDLRIAYQVVGHGSVDLVFVPGFISNLEINWEDPGYARFLGRLSAFSRLIHFDKRGTGLSDRVDPGNLPDLRTRMKDIHAVMDAAGSGRAVLLGASEGAAMSLLFCAAYPDRTRALVLYGVSDSSHRQAAASKALDRFINLIEETWGTGRSLQTLAPGLVQDTQFCDWWGRLERFSASPSAAIALARMNADIDIAGVLREIRAPTLILHRTDDPHVDLAAGRDLARRIASSSFVELPGNTHPIWTGDVDRVADVIEEFVTGIPPFQERQRVLATLLSTRLTRPPGYRFSDRRWSEAATNLRERLEAVARSFGGTVVRWEGDRGLARFDGPAKAIRCGLAVAEACRGRLERLAQGVHVGEVELSQASPHGTTVMIATAIADSASAEQVRASAVTAELCAGSGLRFEPCGQIRFDFLDKPVAIACVATVQHLESARPVPPASIDLGCLSERERQVLELLAGGLSNTEIAVQLQISDHTIKRHVANILGKLDMSSRMGAAAAYLASRGRP
ncbi:alpha/beta fold hydrolase [Chthonobacter albigriseus]|uniref:alpha/beta fold hydrolase n=1 Tax=Chthonobacter albigriseus TaxID=1683161 RepID=UPI0015EF154F|nr:alpha/beta fold hydrolase [Chthonobacter albigriseus]